jgi:hypothetical protein
VSDGTNRLSLSLLNGLQLSAPSGPAGAELNGYPASETPIPVVDPTVAATLDQILALLPL